VRRGRGSAPTSSAARNAQGRDCRRRRPSRPLRRRRASLASDRAVPAAPAARAVRAVIRVNSRAKPAPHERLLDRGDVISVAVSARHGPQPRPAPPHGFMDKHTDRTSAVGSPCACGDEQALACLYDQDARLVHARSPARSARLERLHLDPPGPGRPHSRPRRPRRLHRPRGNEDGQPPLRDAACWKALRVSTGCTI
jgi:hypothetical protein